MDAHGLGILDGDAAEAAASTNNGDCLARPHERLLDALVDGDAGTENRRNGLEVGALGDARNVGGLGNGVLLERAVDGVARQQGLFAERLVAVLAVGAAEARAVEPLDAGEVAQLNVGDEAAAGNDDAGAFVAADEGQRFRVERPVAHHGVEVGVADARVLDVDEDFIGAGLLDGDSLVGGGWE